MDSTTVVAVGRFFQYAIKQPAWGTSMSSGRNIIFLFIVETTGN